MINMQNKQYKLIRAQYVLPFSEAMKSRVIEDGFVLIESDKIKEVGKYSPEAGKAFKERYGHNLEIYNPTSDPDNPVAMTTGVVMPSPKYVHTHFHESLLTGKFKNMNLLDWLDASINPHTLWMYNIDQGMKTGQWDTPNDEAIAKQLGKSPYEIVFGKTLHDVLRYGSGFVAVHHCNFTKYDSAVDAVVNLLEKAHARAIVFPGSQDRYYTPDFLLDTNPNVAVARIRAQMERHNNKKWVKVMPGADQFFSNSAMLLSALKNEARRWERETGQPVYFHVHSSENAGSTKLVRDMTGLSPIAYAQEAGILDERTIVAHQVQTTIEDIAMLARNGVKVISNPTANGSLFSGIAPIAAMLDAGILVAYSTDGSGSSDHQNIFQVMHVGVNMNRGSEREGAMNITDQKALEMILTEPARIYGLDNATSLDPGKDASLIVYDISSEENPAIHPHDAKSIIGKIVFCDPSSAHITDSMSLGEWLVRDKRVLTLDRDLIMKDAALLNQIYWEEVYPKLEVHQGTGKK